MEKKQEQKLRENSKLFNKLAKKYDSKFIQFWMKKFQEPIKKEIKLTQSTKILDISCGTGELLKSLDGKAKLTGLDYSEEMLKNARKKLSKEITLIKADVHNIPFKDETFNYVTNTESFHHYYDQKKALKEMYRITKEGGKIIIIDINFFLKPIHFLFEKLEPGCVKVNSRKEIYKLFKEAGLKNIKQKRTSFFAVMTTGEKF